MLDIELFREEPEKIKDSQRRRGKETGKVEKVVEIDQEWREKLQELEELQEERNKVGDKIAEAKQNGENAEDKIERMQEVKQKIQGLEEKVDELKEERDEVRYQIANLLDESVPEGEGEEDNPEIRTWSPEEGKKEDSELAADIIERNNLLKSEKAAEVGGERAYYLTNELVQLNQALTSFALDFIREKGFDIHQTPYMLEEDAISAAVDMEAFEDQLYQVNENNRYLIATAEHALAAMQKDEVIQEGQLPLKLGGFSTNFRREAGKHGKQTRGLWRVHQFEKVEQFMFTHPETHKEKLEWMLKNAEEIMKELGLPYRVVDICDGDIGDKTFKQYDIEVWRPPLDEYGEVGSYGSCIDYQSNKLRTKFFEDGERKTPYTVYATALANPRIITAIIENNQTSDGVKVPEPLQDYMGGREFLEILE